MSVRVEVVCISGEGDEQRQRILTIDRQELAMETLAGCGVRRDKTGVEL
jgi:hypothetical protein